MKFLSMILLASALMVLPYSAKATLTTDTLETTKEKTNMPPKDFKKPKMGHLPQLNKEMLSQPVITNIHQRRSVRHYTGEVVSKDTLEMLVRCAMAAPTGMNVQPWEFIAVNDPAVIANLAEKLGRTGTMVKEAGAVIVVVGKPSASRNWMLDCAAATENILLAAQSLGLGAVWTAAYPYEDRIALTVEAFGIPEEYIPLCVIPVGFPAGSDMPKDKWREEKLHFDKW